MISGYFEDISVGDVYTSGGRTITEAHIVNFSALTGDWHPLHNDEIYASTGPFGGRIAHGLLVLSVATGLAPLDPETIIAFYGIDRLRFVRPTRLNDTVSVRSEIIGLDERDEKSGLVTARLEVHAVERAGDGPTVALSADVRMLVRRRSDVPAVNPA